MVTQCIKYTCGIVVVIATARDKNLNVPQLRQIHTFSGIQNCCYYFIRSCSMWVHGDNMYDCTYYTNLTHTRGVFVLKLKGDKRNYTNSIHFDFFFVCCFFFFSISHIINFGIMFFFSSVYCMHVCVRVINSFECDV